MRTLLSHEETERKSACGEKLMSDMESEGGLDIVVSFVKSFVEEEDVELDVGLVLNKPAMMDSLN